MVNLLDASIRNLEAQGIRRMFLDGVSNGLGDLKKLGDFYSLSRQYINANFHRL